MASCKQIEIMLQAWIDNELGHAERVILQQHLAECRACTALLQRYQQTSALLFECFNEHRLRRNLRGSILENLPEMNPLRITVHDNKSQVSVARRHWMARYVPAVAVLVLVLLGALLYNAWPTPPNAGATAIGLVTLVSGDVESIRGADSAGQVFQTPVVCGQHFHTGDNSRMIVTLRGPTHVKVNANTLLGIADDRQIRVENGEVCLDVARDTRAFAVETPSGTVKVLGTIFAVAVTPERTVVTVKSGHVQVDNGASTLELKPGEQGEMSRNSDIILAAQVDANQVMAWADALSPDLNAYQQFASEMQMRPLEEMPAEQVFVINTATSNRRRAITSFFLTWEPNANKAVPGHCSYDMHVYNDAMQELFQHRIDGAVFDDAGQLSYEVKVPQAPITDVNVIHIKLTPNFSTGDQRISFSKITALGI